MKPYDHLYKSKNLFVNLVFNQRLSKIVKLIPKKKGKILEAGFGGGHILEALFKTFPENEYYGIDINDFNVRKAQKRFTFASIDKQDITNIKFPDNFFDCIICSETLEHILNYKKAILELKRVTKKNGALILTFPIDFFWTLGRLLLLRHPIKAPNHVNSLTPRKISNVIGKKPVYSGRVCCVFNFIVEYKK